MEGNSITSYGTTWTGITSAIKAGYTPTLRNFAVSGQTTVQRATAAPTTVDIPGNKDKGYNILNFMEGINHIYFGATAAEAYEAIRSYCLARKAYGFKVSICTLTPRQNANAPVWQETRRLETNVLIRDSWSTFADVLVDIGGHPIMGQYATCTNTTYYSDLVHFAPAGNGIFASLVSTAVNSFLP